MRQLLQMRMGLIQIRDGAPIMDVKTDRYYRKIALMLPHVYRAPEMAGVTATISE